MIDHGKQRIDGRNYKIPRVRHFSNVFVPGYGKEYNINKQH
jgi:hypothetical protein